MEPDRGQGTGEREGVTALQKRPRVTELELIAGSISFAIFSLITGLVISGYTQNWDAGLSLLINNTPIGPALSTLMILASIYGREYFWIPVVGLMLLFGKRDTKMLAIELSALFLAGIVAGEIMKYVLFRERPFEVLSGVITRVPIDIDSSYPSGHALIVSIGGIFALVKFRRKSLAFLLALEAAIVCYSRVYVGLHYPLDVISGIFLGGFIVFVGSFLLERSYLKRIIDALTSLAVKILRGGLVSI